MIECTVCFRPLPAGTDRYACPGCEYATRYTLRALIAELPLLRAALAPGSAPHAGSRGAGRAHAPLPVNVRALDLLGPGATIADVPDPHGDQTGGVPLGAMVIGWAHAVARDVQARHWRGGTEYRVPCTPALRSMPSLTAWCWWLERYVPLAATRPWIDALHEELGDALHRVRAITGTRPRKHPRLAPCPACDAFAMVRTDGRWDIDCEACGHHMDPDAYDAHAAAVLPALTATAVWITAAELAAPTEAA